ncbi:MAG: DUF2799 domain-containing protein [Rhizobacter sp.]
MTHDKKTGRRLCGLLWLALTIGLLAGCGGMTKSDCEQANWRELGQRDAESGLVASARFTQRAESCKKAGVGNVNQPEYLAGHALGQINYCTAARGRDEALAGQPPSGVCQAPQVAQAYGTGYDDGLQRFCTPKSGFDFGRFGLTYRNTCPATSANAFQIGYRLGNELHDLNGRLERITTQQANERRVLADTKSTAADRDSANRRLAETNTDEVAVRKMIRQAEVNALSISQPTGAKPVPTSTPVAAAPLTRATAADLLKGQWQVASVKFARPVDLNRDGIKSADAMDEYTACERDARLDIGIAQQSAMRIGENTAGCKATVRAFTWRLGDGKVRNTRQVNGRSVVDERAVVVLQLRDAKGYDNLTMVIESISADELVVRTDLSDGTDSGSEAVVAYTRVKP